MKITHYFFTLSCSYFFPPYFSSYCSYFYHSCSTSTPDALLLPIMTLLFLEHYDWSLGRLWSFVSLRPEVSGINITSIDFLVLLIRNRY